MKNKDAGDFGSKLVQMRLRKNTLDKYEHLKQLLQTDNRTDITKTAIDVLELLADSIKKGGTINIKEKDGSQKQILIPSL